MIKSDRNKIEHLIAFSTGMMSGGDGKELIEKHKEALNGITPYDMLYLEEYQMQMGITVPEIKKEINKILNVLYEYLKEYEWERPEEGTFLYYLMLENRAFEFRLNSMKKILKAYKGREPEELSSLKAELLPHLESFARFEPHYIKKENILFPYLEKHWKEYKPLRVMWSLHDDLRRMIKELIGLAKSEQSEWMTLNRAIGNYYFGAFGMIQKEEIIVYPIAAGTIPKEDWAEMHRQSFDYPFPFIDRPAPPAEESGSDTNIDIPYSNRVATELNGPVSDQFLQRATMIFDSLPLDITYVDENDKVRYFNRAKDRFFPRSPAVIGRDVRNCHPPESLHVVEEIVNKFRSGERDEAEFWITMRGKFIHIRYFAVRSEKGEYKGVLEVSQDVTKIRELQGQRRLLDWE